MRSSWVDVSSSVKASGGAAGRACPAASSSRATNEASWARVIRPFGSKVVAVLPLATPHHDTQPTAAAWTLELRSVNGGGGACCRWGRRW